MAAALTAIFGNFPDSRKAEDRESSAVGEHRTVIAVEAVYASGGFQYRKSGAEIEMICIAKYYLCFDVIGEFIEMYSFYGAHCSDGHEDRGEDIAMVGVQYAGACIRTLVGMLQLEEWSSLAP